MNKIIEVPTLNNENDSLQRTLF